MTLSVLVIDDDLSICELIENAVLLNDGKAMVMNDASNIESAPLLDFNLIFLDLNMPGKDGIEVIGDLSRAGYSGNVVLISGFDDWMLKSAKNLAVSKGLNVIEALTKPFRLEAIELVLAKVADNQKQQQSDAKIENSEQELLSYADIADAIKNKRIKVMYQPQVDLATHTFIGVEALIRIARENGSLIPPHLFLEVAQQHNILNKLTKAIIKTVFRDYQQKIQQYGSIVLSLNLSSQDIEDIDFPDWLYKQTQEYDVEPTHVVLELNDINNLKDSSLALEVLMRLRLKGFKVSYDEVGKTQSVLDLVHNFPITEVKIHPSFVKDLVDNKKTQLLLKTTTHLCRELGLDLVVNGVENQEMEVVLNQMGIVIGQGYFYSKPVSLKDLLTLLKTSSKKVAEASISYLEEQGEHKDVEVDLNNEYKSRELTKQRQEKYLDYQKGGDKHLLLSPLPLTGMLAFIGNSQLLGYELALVQHKATYPNTELEFGVYDDQSDFDRHLDFYQNHLPNRTLAVIGGAFAYQQTEKYLNGIRKVDVPLIAPFNGCSRLRNSDHQNLVNFKPSFKDEMDHIVKHHLVGQKNVLVLRPKEHLLYEYQHLQALYPDWKFEYYHLYSPKKLAKTIHENKIKKVLFIGSAKYLINLMETLDNPEVEFYAASLTGFALIRKILKRTARINLTLTDPVPNLADSLPVVNEFNGLVSHLDKDQRRYVNSVSLEAYLIMKVLLEIIEEKQIASKRALMGQLQDIIGAEIGLDDRMTFSPQTRTLLHKIYEHKI